MTSDGDGLYFKVGSSGGSSWIYRYKIAGKARDMGVGKYPEISLADARTLAADARKLKASGIDPLIARDEERKAKQQLAAQRRSFRSIAYEYHAAHGKSWSEKWRKGWLSKLERYAFPHIGALSANEIGTTQVLKVLQPIWSEKTRTADEVRGQIESILDAAKTLGLRQGDNPARWRGHLENLLSKAEKRKARKRIPLAAMTWQQVPLLMGRLNLQITRDSLAARLMILTGARTHMVRFASWDEFDLDKAVWSLPAARMKKKEAFEIPLAPEVIDLLNAIPVTEGSPYLFPGHGKSGVIHGNAIRNLLHSLGHADITGHGFRSSFRDWAGEMTNFPWIVCELALAHDERSQTQAAYSRSEFLEKRRKLMEAWARYVTSRPGNVVHGSFTNQA